MGKRENKQRGQDTIRKLAMQKETTNRMMAQLGIKEKQLGTKELKSKL